MKVYPFIKAEKAGNHNVKRACELLQVSRAAYCACRDAAPSPRQAADAKLTEHIKQIHRESGGTYGIPRIRAELRRRGIPSRPFEDLAADAPRRAAGPRPETVTQDHDP